MDQESRDANSLLVELDRGLQSQNIANQSEAIARFTSLFQRYPLPILINSACLKLAEAFRCGSNFIRIQICEVFERNQSQLNKIYNVEDFYRNLFTVTTSNDPIARSITLLALGHIAPIVSGNKSIHHCISSTFETTIECELNATIACAACFVKQSAEFACNIYPKIVSIIDSNKSSIDTKIRVLAVLDHGFYNANDAMVVRSFLIDVIGKSQMKKLICACLTLSTKISYTSLSHITAQIELLLGIYLKDSREIIRFTALRNLLFLAEKSPHIWTSSNVEPLVSNLETILTDISLSDPDNKLTSTLLSIFCKLLTCKCNFIQQIEKNRIFKLCFELALDKKNLPLCSMAFEILTVMSEESHHLATKNAFEYKPNQLITDTLAAIKLFLIQTSTRSSEPQGDDNNDQEVAQQVMSNHAMKTTYRHIVKLCSHNVHYCSELLKLVFDRISSKDTPLNELNPYFTELMCAILQYSTDLSLTPDNCWMLIKTKSPEMSETNLLNLCVLYFQTLRLSSARIIPESLIDKITTGHSLWFTFKVMRQAMRYGHFEIAGLICNYLHEHVTTDTIDFYFKSLARICAAESLLSRQTDLDSNLKSALPLYEDSVSPLRASMCNSRTTNFQLQFLWLRIKTLQAHANLRQCCKMHEISPITYATLLNAIGAVRAVGGDQGVSRLGFIQQMPKVAKDFRYLGDCYESLSLVSFDCDDRTLDYIYLLKSSCIIMADVIDAIFQYGRNLPVINKVTLGSDREFAIEHQKLGTACNKLIDLIKLEIIKPGLTTSQKLIEPVILLLKKFSDEILRCPFSYPRYFFQPQQITQIKLAITPQPSSSTGSISLLLNNNLVLKVEGLITNSAKTHQVIRQTSKIVLSVTMSPVSSSDSDLNQSVQSTAIPHNNYFKSEFLLPLKLTGSFNIDIGVSIIDEQERLWKTGPMERLSLLVS